MGSKRLLDSFDMALNDGDDEDNGSLSESQLSEEWKRTNKSKSAAMVKGYCSSSSLAFSQRLSPIRFISSVRQSRKRISLFKGHSDAFLADVVSFRS